MTKYINLTKVSEAIKQKYGEAAVNEILKQVAALSGSRRGPKSLTLSVAPLTSEETTTFKKLVACNNYPEMSRILGGEIASGRTKGQKRYDGMQKFAQYAFRYLQANKPE